MIIISNLLDLSALLVENSRGNLVLKKFLIDTNYNFRLLAFKKIACCIFAFKYIMALVCINW